MYFGIIFGLHGILSFFILQLPLSIIDLKTQTIIMGVVIAIGEEFFFSYCITGLLAPKAKWFTIPFVSLLFASYHFFVYHAFTTLLYLVIMRVVYSLVYLCSRRLSSVTLAHILNNLLVGLRM